MIILYLYHTWLVHSWSCRCHHNSYLHESKRVQYPHHAKGEWNNQRVFLTPNKQESMLSSPHFILPNPFGNLLLSHFSCDLYPLIPDQGRLSGSHLQPSSIPHPQFCCLCFLLFQLHHMCFSFLVVNLAFTKLTLSRTSFASLTLFIFFHCHLSLPLY
jgi:hypothetical protein